MVRRIQSKNRNCKIKLNDGVYLQGKKTICFGLLRPSSGSDKFLLKVFYVVCLNCVVFSRKFVKT